MATLPLLDSGVVAFLEGLPKPRTSEEAKAAGAKFVEWVRAQACAWPEDDWYSLGEHWDINLYLDLDEKPAATLFPVIDGKTRTDVFLMVEVGNVGTA